MNGLGSAPDKERPDARAVDELFEWASRPWYAYGWESPGLLVARFRHGHRWGFRLRMAWQRATRGYGDDDLWNLSHSLAKLTVAGTRAMRESAHGHPAELTWPEWEDILARIEAGFQAFLDTDGWFREAEQEAKAKFRHALALHGEWFGALWD